MPLRYTLVSDGSSDRSLMPVLDWLFREHYRGTLEGQWFDPRPLAPPRLSLKECLLRSQELFPCDVLFVHRDAEGEDPDKRYSEIAGAAANLQGNSRHVPYICVVPVRMTEAWLLFNEAAIRKASGNPNGTMRLDLPQTDSVDQCPDPKSLLFEAIKTASGRTGRRLKKLKPNQRRHHVADFIKDYSPLRKLHAFNRLEADILSYINENQLI